VAKATGQRASSYTQQVGHLLMATLRPTCRVDNNWCWLNEDTPI
jgi:hypothetical protein